MSLHPPEDRDAGEVRVLDVREALMYLDEVKSDVADGSEVYNLFLDVMKDFKSHNIDTLQVIARVLHLFHGHNKLIQGFNMFLPAGYRIESDPQDPNVVVVTTPQGTMDPNLVIDPAWLSLSARRGVSSF